MTRDQFLKVAGLYCQGIDSEGRDEAVFILTGHNAEKGLELNFEMAGVKSNLEVLLSQSMLLDMELLEIVSGALAKTMGILAKDREGAINNMVAKELGTHTNDLMGDNN